VELRDFDGLELQQLLAATRHHMPTIFVTSRGDVAMTVRAMKAGAVDFIVKPFEPCALISAVEAAMERSGATLRDREAMRILKVAYASLTPRERDVMVRVVAGLPNKRVARDLGITEVTVKEHRARMMRKMNARSLPDLVNAASKLGLA